MKNKHDTILTILTTAAIARSTQKYMDDGIILLNAQNLMINNLMGEWALRFIAEHPDKLTAGSEEYQDAIDNFVYDCFSELSKTSSYQNPLS